MTSRARRVLSLLLIVGLVTSSGLAPISGAAPVSTVAAAGTGEDCTALDDFVYFITARTVNADDCSRQAYAEQSIQEMKESDANQTKVDIYSAGTSTAAGQEAFGATYDNYLNDTASVAWMKVESAVASAYQNGSTKAEAKVAAKEAIADYYATKEVNLLEQWNATVSDINVLHEQVMMEDGIGEGFVRPTVNGDGNTARLFVNGTETRTLVDGSSHGVVTLNMTIHDTSSPAYHRSWHVDPYGSNVYSQQTDTTFGPSAPGAVLVDAPDSNYQPATILTVSDYRDRVTRIQSANSDLQAEAETFVNATWTDFESGQVNASDVISSHTAMFEYGVRSGNETEGLWRSTAALALLGFDTPDLNESGTMTVQYNGVNRTGIVMARNAPNGTWSAGTTYNTSNIDGPVFMATTDGKKIDFSGEFRIVGMTAKDGTQLNTTKTTKYVYKTANTSELLEMQQQLIELRQEIEDREPDGAGSGSGSGLDPMLIAGLAAAAVGALALREN